jgi:predicted nucleic acid-binding protein
VVYFDKSGPRIHRPVRRRTPPADSGHDDAKTRYIRQAAADNPKFTPEEVYAEIYYGRRRHDITKAMVHKVLVGRRRTFSVWPFPR